ncbi:Tn7-like element transposition protein TnsE [Anaerosolibacter sp.]|uniref:Tn7-like element transposition protein TnsE n=1 Tax=Anaerosolibacter sp. TaxID=1872527 RepID=UPI0039EEE293
MNLRRLRLRPWPFEKDEQVELFWLCSPYLNKDHNWMFRAAFRDMRNNTRDIELPWGTLPNLAIGQSYKDGLPDESVKMGKIEEIDVSRLNKYEICSGFDMPPGLFYLYKNSMYGRQKVCKFTLRDRTFYVPCVEVIRSFLTPSKLLAYQLLKPQGLQPLVESFSYPHDNGVQINLSRDVPMKLANDDNVMHLLWLLKDKYAKITWDYVYENLFRKANRNSLGNPHFALSSSVLIEARPPYMEHCNWTFRGITVNNDTLILEIMSITGLELPYKYITYTHPSFYKSELVNEPKTAKRVAIKENVDYELDESHKSTNRISNPATIDNAKLRFGFNGFHKVRRTSKRTNVQRIGSHEGNKIIEVKNNKNNIIVGTQDWVYGGGITPLEFRLLEIDYTSTTRGLDEFLQALKYIKSYYEELRLQLNIVFLPEGKNFSYYPNGHRRTCAIVKVETKNKLPCYILEIGREDNWSISTLFVYQLSNMCRSTDDEKLFDRILRGLVNNNGHWDKSFVQQENSYKFDVMKHVTLQSSCRWGERITRRIN